jgi:hypothetical protein
VGFSLLLLLLGWLSYQWLSPKQNRQMATQGQNSLSDSSKQALTQKSRLNTASDSFAQAVRLAEQASTSSQNVKTAAQWLDVAAKWEQAADLMGAVQANDSRYKTAQGRMILYRQYSEVAQKQAKLKRS